MASVDIMSITISTVGIVNITRKSNGYLSSVGIMIITIITVGIVNITRKFIGYFLPALHRS